MPWLVIRWLTLCRTNMDASVTANMKRSGQKLLYSRLTVSLRSPQAVRGDSLQHQFHTINEWHSIPRRLPGQ